MKSALSKTIAAPLAALYQAWTDEKPRRRWLAGAKLAISKATPSKSVRIKWGDGVGRVSVLFYPKGEKNQLTVQHGRLPNARAAERAQAYWKMRLGKLEAFVAGKS